MRPLVTDSKREIQKKEKKRRLQGIRGGGPNYRFDIFGDVSATSEK